MSRHRALRLQESSNDRVGGYMMFAILAACIIVDVSSNGFSWTHALWEIGATVVFFGVAALYGLWHTRPGTPQERKLTHNPFSNEEGFGP
jgi:hypothetical protein